MQAWACSIPYCSYVYNPANGDPTQGIPAGISFEELPSGWVCPNCRAGKEYFAPICL